MFFVVLSIVLFQRERKGERGKHLFVVPVIYAFFHYFFYVLSLRIEPTTLAISG